MLDMGMLASATIIIGFIGSVIAYIARQWYNMKQLMERVGDIESQEEEILKQYMTIEDHNRIEKNCQREIYRDISDLDTKIESINKRLDKSEELREKCRAEDLKWKATMHETVVEIRTIVKGQSNV